MIGWTKNRKRCKTHGLVLRNRNEFDRKGDYCPACGQRLTVVSIPYLFQIYFHPAIMIVPGILVFLGGLFVFLDVKGCIQEGRKADAIAEAAQAESRKNIAQNLPEDWKVIYAAVLEASENRYSHGYRVLRGYVGRLEDKKLSSLTGDEVRMFMQMMPSGYADEAFELVTTCMGEKEK